MGTAFFAGALLVVSAAVSFFVTTFLDLEMLAIAFGVDFEVLAFVALVEPSRLLVCCLSASFPQPRAWLWTLR